MNITHIMSPAEKVIRKTMAFLLPIGITCLPRADSGDRVGGAAGVRHTLLHTAKYHNTVKGARLAAKLYAFLLRLRFRRAGA